MGFFDRERFSSAESEEREENRVESKNNEELIEAFKELAKIEANIKAFSKTDRHRGDDVALEKIQEKKAELAEKAGMDLDELETYMEEASAREETGEDNQEAA